MRMRTPTMVRFDLTKDFIRCVFAIEIWRKVASFLKYQQKPKSFESVYQSTMYYKIETGYGYGVPDISIMNNMYIFCQEKKKESSTEKMFL